MTELKRDFLDPAAFYNALVERNVNFFTGVIISEIIIFFIFLLDKVPDSLLKDICGYISDNVKPSNHIITANEGQAVAVAAGYIIKIKIIINLLSPHKLSPCHWKIPIGVFAEQRAGKHCQPCDVSFAR